MELGMIGLGRMGANMVRRLRKGDHRCVVFDRSESARNELAAEGCTAAATPEELVASLAPPRAIWLMLPAAVVDSVIDDLRAHLEAGDTLIDGGNSYYHDDLRRAAVLKQEGIHYVDVGVSGGVWGLERGYCQMIGGSTEVVERLSPIFATLAPAPDSVARSHGRDGALRDGELGFLHCGPVGAGHFVKMIHNGIEYGMMAAYSEGLNILRHANVGDAARQTDAETAPLRYPEHFQYEFDLPAITELWRRSSVITSWLLDLIAVELAEDTDLSRFSGHVSDSGEGRWTIQAAIDEGVPAPVLSAALYQRFASQGLSDFADRVLSAMRYSFGGHLEKKSP